MMDLNNFSSFTNTKGHLVTSSSAIERLSAISIESNQDDNNLAAIEERNRKTRKRRRKRVSMANELPFQQDRSISRTRSKILKISKILITTLLYHHLCLSNFYSTSQVGCTQANQFGPAGNLSEPQQFFMASDQNERQSTIKLVGNGLKPRSEEEEDGFIMRTSSSSVNLQNQASSQVATNSSDQIKKAIVAATEQPTAERLATITDDDQRIPINLNGRQYVTHEQLSLLNASTKDEHINLAGNEDNRQTPDSTNLLQRVQSPRTGLSKVSQVSSLFSGISALAAKFRPPSIIGNNINSIPRESQYLAAGQRTDISGPQSAEASATITTTPATPTTTSAAISPIGLNLPDCQSVTGVCRNFITSFLICRNEINATCPSIYQKCCERDNVSFNGTPVEVSAPLAPSDTDSNSAPLSDSLQSVQEQSALNKQANLPKTPAPPTASEQQEQQRIHQAGNGTESSRLGSEESADVSSIQINSQPTPGGSTYFLSSGNGSEPAPVSTSAPAGGAERDNIPNQIQSFGRKSTDSIRPTSSARQREQQADLAQSIITDGGVQPQQQPAPVGHSGRPHSASQSFDSSLTDADGKSALDRLPDRVVANHLIEQQRQNGSRSVLVQTAIGTIVHQTNPDQFRRPVYRNYTDFQLSKQTLKQPSASVVYHSNTDPVKGPLGWSLATSPARTGSSLAPPSTTEQSGQPETSHAEPSTSAPGREQSLAGSNLRRSSGDEPNGSLEPTAGVVTNDQHSSINPIQPRPQQVVSGANLVEASTTSDIGAPPAPGRDQSAGIASTKLAEIGQEQVSAATTSNQTQTDLSSDLTEDRQSGKSLVGLLTDLIGIWATGDSAAETAPAAGQQGGSIEAPESNLEAQQSNRVPSFAPSDGSVLQASGQQQTNDRRLGLDSSAREQSRSPINLNRRQQDSNDVGLMTSDGSSEQQVGASGGSGGGTDQGAKCEAPNYCIQTMFVQGSCVKTFRSRSCMESQVCCQQRPASQSNEAADEQVSGSMGSASNSRYPANCRDQGECLAFYHQSLCARPNEIQYDPPGCAPSHVCCLRPSFQSDATSHNYIEDSAADSNTQEQTKQALGAGQLNEMIKDSALFTALVPPLPSSLNGVAEQQDTADQFMTAAARQRPSSMMQPMGQESAPLGTIQQGFYQQQKLAVPRPASATKSSQTSAGGLMSQLYQSLFKSNGPSKQRNRPQQQQQQQQVAAPSQIVQSFMSQMLEPYLPAAAQSGTRGIQVAAPQQQLVFPMQQGHNVLFSQQPSNNYQLSLGDFELDINKQQQQQGNRNAFVQQQQQQYLQAEPSHAGSSPAIQRANGHQLLKGVALGQQQQQVQQLLPTAVSGHPFGDNGQQQQQQLGLINQEKFVGQNLEHSSNFAQTTNMNGAAQQQNYVKPFMAATSQQQVPAVAAASYLMPTSHIAAPGSNPNERQRFHYAANKQPDNAHNVPFNQPAPMNGQSSLPRQSQGQFAATGAYSSQPMAFGLGAASVQQQQQHPGGKLVDASQSRLAGNGAQGQQASRSQQHFAGSGGGGGSRNGNGGQKAVVRVSSANEQRQQQQVGPESFPNRPSLGQSSASRVPAPIVQQSDRLSPMEQQLLMAAQKAQVEFAQKTGSAQIKSGGSPAGTKGGWSPTGPSQSGPGSSISPSSSNLNVLISSAPHLEQQHRAPEAAGVGSGPNQPRRGQQVVKQQQQPLSSSSVSQNRPPMVFSSPILSAEQQQRMQAELSAEQVTCPVACLAPFVSFNCQKPNYIDPSLACRTAGAICCVPAGGFAQQATKADPLQQLAATSLGTARPALNVLDSNKLDSMPSSDNDEQLDEPATKPLGPPMGSGVEQPAQMEQASPFAVGAPINQEETASSSVLAKDRFSCGLRGSRRRAASGQARGRVMGGFDSKPGDWCWQAALLNNKNEYLCGGALIGKEWVLTAAHCVTTHLRNETQLFVGLGQHNLNYTEGGRPTKTIQVRTSYVHHNHHDLNLDNDIALLRLEEPVGLEDPAICLVCLPERSSQMEVGKRCTVTGYGHQTEDGFPTLRIRETDLPIIEDSECLNKTSAALNMPFSLPANSFCAGGEPGQDACKGDGGSPLSCLVNGYYELTGIVSWGFRCGEVPGVYAKVSNFVGWINQIVSINN